MKKRQQHFDLSLSELLQIWEDTNLALQPAYLNKSDQKEQEMTEDCSLKS